MAAIEITETELLEALVTASGEQAPSQAKTRGELCAELGLSRIKCLNALKALRAQGRLVTHSVRREDIAGRMGFVAAYTILPVQKKAKR